MRGLDRFLAKVEVTPEGCWVWIGGSTGSQNKYGIFRVPGKRGWVSRRAHAWIFEHVFGPVPEGRVLDHLCRNTKCVNPEHLEAVTQAENNARSNSASASNARKTHCPAGHEYAGDNVYIRPSGGRKCRACERARWERKKKCGK